MKQHILTQLAAVGARLRVQELEREQQQIKEMFPAIFADGAVAGTPTPVKTASTAHHMSAAQRRAVSLRMKAYWAGKRKAARK